MALLQCKMKGYLESYTASNELPCPAFGRYPDDCPECPYEDLRQDVENAKSEQQQAEDHAAELEARIATLEQELSEAG